jgi:phage I-like protein
MDPVLLHSALPAADDAPDWVHLVPDGVFAGVDGRGPYTLADPAAVVAASLPPGHRLVIDECHATDLAAPRGLPAPARGWIVEMEARTDGLWGRVEWTQEGRALVASRAYRGFSPALFVAKASGAVTRVLRGSLTNDPNLPVANLHARITMDVIGRVRAALGLFEEADEAAIIAAIEALKGGAPALMARLAKASGAPDGATVEALELHLSARREVPAEIVALQSRLATVEGERRRERAVVAIDAWIAEGKPIARLREHYITRHAASAEAAAVVQAELDGLPSLNAGGTGGRATPKTGERVLAPEDEKMIELMGLDREAYLKTMKNEERV